MIKIINCLFFSFPVQLLINHLKKNQILLFCWIMLFAIVTDNFGGELGIPYLFLDPEYLNHVNFWSFFIVGISISGFTIAFHITSYIIDGHQFNFLGTLTRPFTKFCINNGIIPLIFILSYTFYFVQYQYYDEFNSTFDIITKVAGFFSGFLCMSTLLFTYFRLTNKDIFKLVVINVDKQLKKAKLTRVNVMQKLDRAKKKNIRVENYFDINLKVKKIKHSAYYDKATILKVFDQNHFNLVSIELLIFILLLVLGIFRDYPYFQIPAAASGTLLFTILIMFAGAITYWFRGWATTIVIAFFIVLNFLVKNDIISGTYHAFGLNYDKEPVVYSLKTIKDCSSKQNIKKDKANTLKILTKWKSKFTTVTKPKMVFICTSGGGQRAALWTLHTLQNLDNATQGDLMNNTALVTGASGGLIGASYFRELILQKKLGYNINPYDSIYTQHIANDNLNSIIFSLLVNDLFIKYQSFDYEGHSYQKDRGYAFEEQLNTNTRYLLDKTIADYKLPEEQALIPMLIMAPNIINDGRKLFISPHNISYMNFNYSHETTLLDQKICGIDFLRFFKEHDAQNLRFLTALRMTATFPYITPNIALPSSPAMELMDSGISDNFGIADALRFLYVFKDWISKNTSGVIILSIRDSEKNPSIEQNSTQNMFQKFFTPLKSLYANWDKIQDINNDNQLTQATSWYKGTIHQINLVYSNNTTDITPEKRASLSWRLTGREKNNIKQAIHSKKNKQAINRLKMLLKTNQ